MKHIFLFASILLASVLSAETVTRSDEMGQWKDSGVSSGFWDLSKRTTPTYERTSVSADGASGYDTRWYTEFTSAVFTLFRGMPGLMLLFR